MPITTINRPNFNFTGELSIFGLPWNGHIACRLGEGIKDHLTGELMALIIFIGQIYNGQIHGNGRLHILHCDPENGHANRFWIGTFNHGLMDLEQSKVTDMSEGEMDFCRDYCLRNSSLFSLDLGYYTNLGQLINVLIQKTDDELRTDCIRDFATAVMKKTELIWTAQKKRSYAASAGLNPIAPETHLAAKAMKRNKMN